MRGLLGGRALVGKCTPGLRERRGGRRVWKQKLEGESSPVWRERPEGASSFGPSTTGDWVEQRYLQWGNLYPERRSWGQEGMGETGLTQCLGNLGLEGCRTGLTQQLGSLEIGEPIKKSQTPMEVDDEEVDEVFIEEGEINTMELVGVLDELIDEGGGGEGREISTQELVEVLDELQAGGGGGDGSDPGSGSEGTGESSGEGNEEGLDSSYSLLDQERVEQEQIGEEAIYFESVDSALWGEEGNELGLIPTDTQAMDSMMTQAQTQDMEPVLESQGPEVTQDMESLVQDSDEPMVLGTQTWTSDLPSLRDNSPEHRQIPVLDKTNSTNSTRDHDDNCEQMNNNYRDQQHQNYRDYRDDNIRSSNVNYRDGQRSDGDGQNRTTTIHYHYHYHYQCCQHRSDHGHDHDHGVHHGHGLGRPPDTMEDRGYWPRQSNGHGQHVREPDKAYVHAQQARGSVLRFRGGGD